MRRKTDSAVWMMAPPRRVSIQKISAGSVPAEWLIPEGATEGRMLLYIYGGAFVFCSLATHRGLAARLAIAGGTRALSVDYRLAPEHPFPAALDDCQEAYRFAVRSGFSPRRIVVGGDSAGGNLTLALLLALRKAGEPPPAAAVCLSPVTDLAWTGESSRTNAKIDPIFPERISQYLPKIIESGYIRSEDPRNPLISPLYGDWSGMPTILLHVGEDEILLDDSLRLAEHVRGAGGKAEVVIWPHMWHVFQIFAPCLPEANQSIAQIGAFIREMQQ
jgi:epsilon-lactone hydrolase